MTKWLASVQSLAEAQELSMCLPDILDMKQPAQGALGALPTVTVESIVKWAAGRCLTSATIGDLPMQADSIATAMQNMAKTGVDFVKIGLFADADIENCIYDLGTAVKGLGVPVIAVLFADLMHDTFLIKTLYDAGFSGVMVDTANKDGRGLLDHWTEKQIKEFIGQAKKYELMTGLAGALKCQDIMLLSHLNADYLGFRSALCKNRERTASLSVELAKTIQQLMHEPLSTV